MNNQVRGLGKAGLLPARAKSSKKNHSHGPTQSTANGSTPGPAPPAAQAPLPPPEPRAESVTSPPPLVIPPTFNHASTAPRLPPIAETAAVTAAATAHDGAPQPSPGAPHAAVATASGHVAAPDRLPRAAGAGAADAAATHPPSALGSPLADQATLSGRRKPRKTRPLPDETSEPPAKRSRGDGIPIRRGRGRGRGRARSSSRRARSEDGSDADDDGADLVGLRIEVPGSIFFVDTPGLVYVCDVRKKDERKRNAVEVVFRDDASVYWFPVADVRRWLAEQQARDAAGTVPLVAGAAGVTAPREAGQQDSEATVVDEAEQEEEEVEKERKKVRKRGKSDATAVRQRAHMAAAAAAEAAAHEDGSSLEQEGGALNADEELAACALTDISVGGSGSRGGHSPVDSAPHGHTKGTSRLQHAG